MTPRVIAVPAAQAAISCRTRSGTRSGASARYPARRRAAAPSPRAARSRTVPPPWVERGEPGAGVFLPVHEVGDQAEHLRHLLAFHGDPVLDDPDFHGDAVAGQLGPVGAVGQDLRGPPERDVALEPDQHVRGLDEAGDPRGPVVVAVHQPDPAGLNRPGYRVMASSSRACSDPALSVPAGPCGIANSARHEQQVSGSARRHGYGPLSSLVPTVPKNALFAGVSGTRSSVPQRPGPQRPSFPDGHRARASSVLVLPPGRAQDQVPQFFQGDRAERVPPVPGRPRRRRPPRPRPRHQRQVPGQRRDHVLDAGVRHQRHQNDHPDHERPGQQPLPFPLHEPGAQRRPPCDPIGDARPGLVLQRASVA